MFLVNTMTTKLVKKNHLIYIYYIVAVSFVLKTCSIVHFIDLDLEVFIWVEVEYMMPFTHLIKLSLTVDFILVNKCQHDPVTDNGTLEGWHEKEKTLCDAKSHSVQFKVSRKKMNVAITHNPNWSHCSHRADDGWDGTEFTSLKKKWHANNIMTSTVSWNRSDDDGVSTYMSVNYDIQTDAVGLDERPRLYPILIVIFGKPRKLHRNYKG